jgi:hypothetical protein
MYMQSDGSFICNGQTNQKCLQEDSVSTVSNITDDYADDLVTGEARLCTCTEIPCLKIYCTNVTDENECLTDVRESLGDLVDQSMIHFVFTRPTCDEEYFLAGELENITDVGLSPFHIPSAIWLSFQFQAGIVMVNGSKINIQELYVEIFKDEGNATYQVVECIQRCGIKKNLKTYM